MLKIKNLPSPITILVIVMIIGAIATWLLPSGEYHKLSYSSGHTFTLTTPRGDQQVAFTQHTLDSLKVRIPLAKFSNGDIRKPVSVPGTYQQLKKNSQGALDILKAPIKGIYESIDIILFILFLGGFMAIVQQTGAIEQGIYYLSHRMKGREAWLIVSITFFFSFCGSSFGMAEEGLIFYPVLVPLFLAAGYDLLVPLATIFAGTTMGNLSSFCNPFATIIASNAAGISWTDGLFERLAFFVVSTGIAIWYIVTYAKKVKKHPETSLVYRLDGVITSPYPAIKLHEGKVVKIGIKNSIVLVLFLITLLTMIAGVVFFDWWLLEMSALFLGSAIVIAVIARINEKQFIDLFIKGAETLLSVAFIVGVARGVTIILNEGHISDTILYYSEHMVSGMPPVLFVVVMFVMFMVFTLFISSSSGMAVLTMPIFGSLANIIGVPGREIVNAYLFGFGIMSFITPNGMILPSLAMVNISLKTWLRFIYPLLIVLSVLCILFLLVGTLI
jgi:uncharacterized ion transporter superfamily protein YfcC